MAPSAIAQRRTHNLLLFQKLLNLRDGASPFTLLLDTLEQSSQPVVREFITRAKVSQIAEPTLFFTCIYQNFTGGIFFHEVLLVQALCCCWHPGSLLFAWFFVACLLIIVQIAKSKVIFVSFQTLKSPSQVDVVIRAHGKPLAALKQEILTHLPPPPSVAAPTPSASKS